MEKLKYRINHNPQKITIEGIRNRFSYFSEANDKFYRKNMSSRGLASFLPGIGILAIGSVFLIPGGDLKFRLISFSIFASVSLFLFIYGFVGPKKEIVLNRMDGLITVPGFMWAKSFTIQFSEGHFYKQWYQRSEGILASQLIIKHKNNQDGKWQAGRLSDDSVEETWSFYVWFMDKNRPLPPGSAFDPYRQKDFERRKAEGFPRPIYPSGIPTPEATPEQQKERENYWKG